MIHPTELRIGNVFNLEGNVYKIYGITEEGFVQYERDNEIYYCSLNEMSPIELTEEILLKCNFKKCEDKNCPGKCYIIDIGDEKDLSYCFKSYNVEYNCIYLNTKKIKIDYLHQLQNFVFAYTGAELDVSKVIE